MPGSDGRSSGDVVRGILLVIGVLIALPIFAECFGPGPSPDYYEGEDEAIEAYREMQREEGLEALADMRQPDPSEYRQYSQPGPSEYRQYSQPDNYDWQADEDAWATIQTAEAHRWDWLDDYDWRDAEHGLYEDLVDPTIETIIETAIAEHHTSECDCSYNRYDCDDFSDRYLAQSCYEYCQELGAGDLHWLDEDKDGLACEPYPRSTTTQPQATVRSAIYITKEPEPAVDSVVGHSSGEKDPPPSTSEQGRKP